MARHALKTMQHLLLDVWSVSDQFKTLYIKWLNDTSQCTIKEEE